MAHTTLLVISCRGSFIICSSIVVLFVGSNHKAERAKMEFWKNVRVVDTESVCVV